MKTNKQRKTKKTKQKHLDHISSQLIGDGADPVSQFSAEIYRFNYIKIS